MANGTNKPVSLPAGNHSSEDCAAFGASVLKRLQSLREPHFILDGIVRVDLFCADDGRIVVNELESFEAGYSSQSRPEAELETNIFLENYWERKINECICSLFEQCT